MILILQSDIDANCISLFYSPCRWVIFSYNCSEIFTCEILREQEAMHRDESAVKIYEIFIGESGCLWKTLRATMSDTPACVLRAKRGTHKSGLSSLGADSTWSRHDRIVVYVLFLFFREEGIRHSQVCSAFPRVFNDVTKGARLKCYIL